MGLKYRQRLFAQFEKQPDEYGGYYDPREVQRLINATTGVNRGRTRAIRTQRARTAARRVSRGGMGG